MNKNLNKSTLSYQEKVKEVSEHIDYILRKYNFRLQIQLQPTNWFSRKFAKHIKINAGIVILDNNMIQQPPVSQPAVIPPK
jgi:hypothetical protein